jgi:ketosteroid isomerase-like protein
MPSSDRVRQLISMVEAGRFVEAIEEFYAPQASMQENAQPKREGLETLVAGERRVLASFKSVRTLPVETFFVDGDRSVIRWVFEFTGHDGRSFRQDELAYQRWDGDKIVEERFYYDPAQTRTTSQSSASAPAEP